VVVDEKAAGYNRIAEFTTGASAVIEGALVRSPAKGQTWEVHARAIELAGSADVSYPLQKKGHSLEFLRTIAHLRPRSNLFGAVFRTRSRVAAAVHRFFQERDFVYVHTPIITSSDCEGAGELFRVVTRPETDATPAEFFGRPAFLTVSGQLEAEILACALSNVYTFGPTFRAENSNTSRHASEFWMIEPEMAFCDLDANATLAEEFIRETTRATLETCQEDLEFFSRFVEKDLLNRLQALINRKFERLAYADAIKILLQSKKQFEHPVEYGLNLQSEHERFLTEEHFKAPVVVCNYPKQIKPFYMR
jgi:asparaginyl-tRNA synthetase